MQYLCLKTHVQSSVAYQGREGYTWIRDLTHIRCKIREHQISWRDMEFNRLVRKRDSPKSWRGGKTTIFATVETKRKLGRVNFCKDFCDCYRGRNWPIAEWHVPSDNPRSLCEANSAQFPSYFLSGISGCGMRDGREKGAGCGIRDPPSKPCDMKTVDVPGGIRSK